jgi:hypothetical protein
MFLVKSPQKIIQTNFSCLTGKFSAQFFGAASWQYFSIFSNFSIKTQFENYVGIHRKQKILPEFREFFCLYLLV